MAAEGLALRDQCGLGLTGDLSKDKNSPGRVPTCNISLKIKVGCGNPFEVIDHTHKNCRIAHTRIANSKQNNCLRILILFTISGGGSRWSLLTKRQQVAYRPRRGS